MMMRKLILGAEYRSLTTSLLLAFCVFLADSFTPIGYNVWILHAIPILITSLKANRRNTTIIAIVCTLFTIIGLFIAPTDIPIEYALINRTLGIAVFWYLAVSNVTKEKLETGGSNLSPIHIVAMYVLVSGLWITLSDSVLAALVEKRDLLIGLSQIKGWAFVLLTGSLLYVMLQRYVSSQTGVENELRRNKERLHRITAAAQAFIYEIDSQGTIVFANRTREGLIHDQAIGTKLASWLPRHQQEAMERLVEEAFASGISRSLEHTMLNPEGELRTYSSSITPVTIEGVTSIVLTAIDISERKRIENELRESEAMLKHSQRVAVAGHYALDITTGLWKSSEMLDEIFGIAGDYPKTVEGWLHIVHPEQRSEMLAYFQEHVLRDGNSFDKEYRILRVNDRTEHWLHGLGNLELNNEGKPIRMFGVIQDITERKRAEEELQQSHERFQLIAQATNDAVRDWDMTQNSLWWNRTFYETYGYPEHSLSDIETWESHIHPDDRERVKAKFHEAINQRVETWSDEYRFLHANGSYSYVVDRGFLVWNENGEPIRMLGSMVDVTSLKLAELDRRYLAEERDQVLKQLQLQFERMPIGYLVTDKDFRITDWNPACEKIFGYSKEEAVGRQALELIVPPSVMPFQENFLEKLRKSEQTLSAFNENVTKDGRAISCEWFDTPLRDEHGEFVGAMAMVQDITERKKAEEELRRSEERFSKVFHANAIAIAYGTLDSGFLLDVNNRYADFFGYPRNDLIGSRAGDLWTNGDDYAHAMHLLREKGFARDIETKFRRRSGQVRDGLVSMEVISFGNEQVLLTMVQDITERKLVEEELKKSNAQLRQLSAYLQSVREEERKRISREIHDELGQELTALKMEVFLMQKAASRLETMETKVTLQDHAASLVSITDGAIQTVRRIATELRPDVLDKLGLADALRWHAKEFEKRTGIVCSFESKIHDQEFSDNAATAIFRIFQEALTNVARHSGASTISAILMEHDNSLQLHVEDDGRGISEEEISKTSSLGLAGIRERARLLGGNAAVKGKKEKGTVVTVSIPLDSTLSNTHNS